MDAVSHGFNVVIPREAVGDRFEDAHRQSLADMDLKYADVVSVEEVRSWLGGIRPQAGAATTSAEWPVGGR